MSHNLLEGSTFLEFVDWNTIVEQISKYSHFDSTKLRLSSQLTFLDKSEISQEYDSLDYFYENLEHFDNSKIDILLKISSKIGPDFKSIILKSAELEIEQLNALCLCYEFYSTQFKKLSLWNQFSKYEIDQSSKDRIRNQFSSTFRKFVDRDGNADFEKHPLLKDLFNQLRKLESSLRGLATSQLKNSEFKDIIQFEQFDIVNDKFTIPVRSDSYKSTFGSIIGRSTTGHTLYIEPLELKALNNQRIETKAKIESILSKICREYTEVIQRYLNEFNKLIDLSLDVDWHLTKASYVLEVGLVRPELSDKFEFNLKDFFHPLVDNPIKNDLEIGPNKKGFIISGPNTGGKTVALKTFIVTNLFVHLGLFVPARKAKVFPAKEIYFYSNDQQNLNEGLSSFASESKNYMELLTTIGDHSLIIVDEIFNSTSSEEASALAIAFLEKLHSKVDCKVLISTHHQLFKTHIHSDNGYISAHVGYDIKIHSPTYKIYIGEPGSSMALTIFNDLSKRFGVETDISEVAGTILSKKHVTYEKLLEELSHKKSKLDRYLLENSTLNKELKNQKKSMEGVLQLERERLTNKFEKKLNKIVDQADYLKRQAKKGNIDNPKAFARQLHDTNRQMQLVKEGVFKQNDNHHLDNTKVNIDELKIGDFVYSTILNKEVEIISINTRKKELQIKNGNMKALFPIKSFSTNKKLQHKKKALPDVKISVNRTVSGQIELDCRGLRLEEFQRKVETSINEVISGDIPFVNIIHGHGSGILKKWLREYLRSHKELKYDNNEGNDGSTRVELK